MCDVYYILRHLINAAQYVRMVAKLIYCMKQIKNSDYYITENGEVWNDKLKRMMASHDNGRGYLCLGLSIDGKRRRVKVHRLVAEAFIPNPLNLPEVDHDDRDKTNNNVSNLKWITSQGNKERALAKTYYIEVVATGEIIKVYNLLKWCRDNDIHCSSLNHTKSGQDQHKGFRLLP